MLTQRSAGRVQLLRTLIEEEFGIEFRDPSGLCHRVAVADEQSALRLAAELRHVLREEAQGSPSMRRMDAFGAATQVPAVGIGAKRD